MIVLDKYLDSSYEYGEVLVVKLLVEDGAELTKKSKHDCIRSWEDKAASYGAQSAAVFFVTRAGLYAKENKKEVNPYEIETVGGNMVDLSTPGKSRIKLKDIAHGLSLICRFNGQCSRFYSVAEHAVLVSEIISANGHGPRLALIGLHHDDAEAYLGDVSSPLKRLLKDSRYDKLTDKMNTAIAAAFKNLWVPADLRSTVVDGADKFALALEAKRFMPSKGIGWADSNTMAAFKEDTNVNWGVGISPEFACQAFIDRHNHLVDQLVNYKSDRAQAAKS